MIRRAATGIFCAALAVTAVLSVAVFAAAILTGEGLTGAYDRLRWTANGVRARRAARTLPAGVDDTTLAQLQPRGIR